MKNRIEMIALGACGMAGVFLAVGLLARLSASLIRISGVVLMASLVFSVYRLAKERNA